MILKTRIPDVDVLKSLDCAGFARVVCASLGRYGLRSPAFNLAAGAFEGPATQPLFLYPAAAQGLVSTSLKALDEYAGTRSISRATREEFILAEVKDILGNMEADKGSAQYKSLCDHVMGYVTSRLTSISSLALSPVSPHYPKNSPGV